MKKIGIIGGGISGLTLGCVLKGYGKECIIFERSSVLSEHGAGLSLTPNACKILNEIDEISEYNYLLITIIYNHLVKNNNKYSDIIFKKVTEFTNYKIKDFKSLTNKCIFKHMDIIDEIS